MSDRDGNLRGSRQRRWSLLLDRVLLYARAGTLRGDPPLEPSRRHSGFLVTGHEGLPLTIAAERARGGETVLLDPARYETAFASGPQPFHVPRDCTGQLELLPEGRSLSAFLDRQLTVSGAPLALTPTGYLARGAREALRTAARSVRYETDEDSTVLVLPLDSGWLADEADVRFLIRELRPVTALKAFVLGADRNPLKRVSATRSLRSLLSEVPGVALIRTDLAGLDAIAHDAVFAAIGTRSSLRHARPPGEAFFGATGRPAHVLHPLLLRYSRCSVLTEKYRSCRPPVCDCEVCQGQSLTRFPDTEQGALEAERHNAAVVYALAKRILEEPTEPLRRTAWRQMCAEAVLAHDIVNRKLGYEAFRPDPALETWAGLR